MQRTRTPDSDSESEFTRFGVHPANQGLYNAQTEHDACGLAMVATLRGTAGHDIVEHALDALRHLEHRGAVGSDAGTGDGAGILLQIRIASSTPCATSRCPPPASTPPA
jgi:glutamate synthase (NADPH) large chain